MIRKREKFWLTEDLIIEGWLWDKSFIWKNVNLILEMTF